MKNLKSSKGIALLELVVTIVIMMILVIALTTNITSTLETRRYYAVKEDIIALTESIQKYYVANGSVPSSETVSFDIDTLNPSDKNPNDNGVYYKIDIDKLLAFDSTIELNNPEDTYLVNEQSLTVYYEEGVKLDGKIHYTVVDDFSGGSFAESYYSNTDLPIISAVTLKSSGQQENRASVGDTVTLKMIANYTLTTEPTVTINGQEVSATWNGRVGKATYTVTKEDAIGNDGKKIEINISGYAADGRNGKEINDITFGKAVSIADPSIDGVIIPEGFYYVGGRIGTGIVISDNESDQNMYKGRSNVGTDLEGNQYVWIEVPQTNKVYPTAGLNITSFSSTEYTKIENDLHTYTSDYRKSTPSTDTYYSGCGLSSTSQYNTLKQKMLKSVYQNGGFWIGRYETGLTNRYRTYGEEWSVEHPITDTPVIQWNAYPYVWLRCSQAQTLASNMYSGNCTSSLLFGVQWDLTLKYMETKGIAQKVLNEDSTEVGNYPNTVFTVTNGKYSLDKGVNWSSSTYTKQKGEGLLHTTGAVEQFKLLNIYDLAGNVWEWTLENSGYSSAPCRSRGGDFVDLDGTDIPASARNLYGKEGDPTTNNYHGVGFRVTFY